MAKNSFFTKAIPSEVEIAIKAFGSNLKVARKRRSQTQRGLARRLMVSATTLRRMEAGDPGIAIGIVATALWSLGLLGDFRNLADPDKDKVGKALDLQRLPKSVRLSKAEHSNEF